MPSQLHEALKLLFELDEHFLLDLLPGAGISVEGLVIEGTLPTSVSVPELASDACLRLRYADGARWIVVVEVQLGIDESKRWTWPVYETEAARRGQAPASVLVLTVEEKVEAWATNTALTRPSGSRFVPLVVGPRFLARLGASARESHPALALLRSLANPTDPESRPHGPARTRGPHVEGRASSPSTYGPRPIAVRAPPPRRDPKCGSLAQPRYLGGPSNAGSRRRRSESGGDWPTEESRRLSRTETFSVRSIWRARSLVKARAYQMVRTIPTRCDTHGPQPWTRPGAPR